MPHFKSRENFYYRKKIFTNSAKLIFKRSISLFAGQGILIGLYILLLTPFLSLLLRLSLSVTGYSYITVNNIGFFLMNPIVLLLLVLLLAVMAVILLLEACYLISFYTQIEKKEKLNFIKVLIQTFKKLILVFWRRNFNFLPIVWLITILSNLPLWVIIVKRVRFISFITEELKYKKLISGVLVFGIILLLWVMLQIIFKFLYFLIEGKSYKKTVKIGADKKLRTTFYFFVWNLGIVFIDLLLYIVILAVMAFFIAGIPDRSLAIATFLTINDKINGYLFIGIFAINTMANYALYTHLYFQYKLELKEEEDQEHSVDNISIRVGAYKKVINIMAVLLAAVVFYSFYDIVRNGSPLDYMNLDMIHVTSHRGFSAGVPENTLPAIEKAIEEQADFVEVDVRMTKDGELVLLHDDNLWRTTGLNKKIWQTTYEEISRLDAGSWKDKRYSGAKIPTLREVFDLCKGKINLNLDIKYHNKKEGLEEKAAALIKEYEMQWQCVITSTSLTALEHIKELVPDIRTGYITYQIYKGYFNNSNIDFFSVRSDLVTKTVSSEVHKAGKEIHVWTVNSRNELERMKRVGVDNIITDDPAYAKEVLYSEEADRFLLTLFKIVME